MTEAKLIIDPTTGVVRRLFRNKGLRVVGTVGKSGYVRLRVGQRTDYAHRLIWEYVHGPIPEGMHIDHINGVRTDNRLDNLRVVTTAQNAQNRPNAHRNNRNGVKGVTWFKSASKWGAKVTLDGRQYHLGLFDTVEDARLAREGAVKLLHSHAPVTKEKGPAETGPKGSNTQESTMTDGFIL